MCKLIVELYNLKVKILQIEVSYRKDFNVY